MSSGRRSFAVTIDSEFTAALLRGFRVEGDLYKEGLVSVVEAGALGWEELVVVEGVHFGQENVLSPSHVIQLPLSRRQSSLRWYRRCFSSRYCLQFCSFVKLNQC